MDSEAMKYKEDLLEGLPLPGVTRVPFVSNMSFSNIDVNQTSGVIIFKFYQTEQVTFLCLLFVVILVFNSSIIAAILLSKTRKSRMNFFIIMLAIADLATGLVSVLTDIIWKTTIEWHAGNVGCKIVRYLQGTTTFASTYTLVAMSVDRLDAILRPMNFTGSRRRSRALVSCAWLFACLMASPLLVISQEWPIGGIKQCWINLPQHWHWRLYVSLLAAVLYVCPAIIITICYMVIVITIWSKGALAAETQQFPMKIFKKTVKNDILVSTPIARRRTENMYEFLQTSSRGLIPKAKIKTIKMTLVIVLAFVFCWSPFFLFDLLDVFGHIPMSQRKVAIAIFIQSLAPLNSAANPIIYCLFNTRLCNRISRMKIVQLLCCKWKQGDMIPGTPEHGACQYSSRFSMAPRESRTSTTRDPCRARNNSPTVTRPVSIRTHAHNNATFFSNGDKTFSDGL